MPVNARTMLNQSDVSKRLAFNRSGPKLTREARNELVHHIWGQSNYQFLIKCVKTKFEIKGVVGPEEHRNHNKRPDGLASSAA